MNKNIITIDGTACSGKGTLAQLLAQQLGWFHLDSGLLYRAAGYLLYQLPHQQAESFSVLKEELKCLSLERQDGVLKVLWHHTDITASLRTQQVSQWASLIAQESFVREALLPLQQEVVQLMQGVVADGRDMGTVVFPQALHKFYLTASVEVRAERRFAVERRSDDRITLNSVLEQLKERDLRDSTRRVAPLRKPQDALEIDTGACSIEEALALMLKHVKNIEIDKR